MDIGQLQSSWEPFGDHGMKLVAFKTIHAHAFEIKASEMLVAPRISEYFGLL